MNAKIENLASIGRMASRLGVLRPGPQRALLAAEAAGYASALLTASRSPEVVSRAQNLLEIAMRALNEDRPQILNQQRETPEVVNHEQ